MGSYFLTNTIVTDPNIKLWYTLLYVIAMMSSIIIIDDLENECYQNNNISLIQLNNYKTYVYCVLSVIPLLFVGPFIKKESFTDLFAKYREFVNKFNKQ